MTTKAFFAIILIALNLAVYGMGIKAPTVYVVIGAFSIKENAIHFVEQAKEKKLDAHYDINPARNLFYVYILQTGDKKQAFTEIARIRTETSYNDAWVFQGELGAATASTSKGIDINPVTEQKLERLEETQPLKEEPPKQQEGVVSTPVVEETKTTVAPLANDFKADRADDPNGRSKVFLFKIYEGDKKFDNEVVNVIDPEKQKTFYSLKGNIPVLVNAVNASGNLKLECQVNGYRKTTQLVNFKNPAVTDGVVIENNQVIVPFELVRPKKGDLSLYNVYFFKDAAIMRPESKAEVDGLLGMMNQNRRYKIRVHGHTNGNGKGKIIQRGESGDFFSLDGSKEDYGSAKQLSAERADLIKEYLVAQGIAPDRIETKAWGGKKPIYDKNSNQAQANVRVEIEITEE